MIGRLRNVLWGGTIAVGMLMGLFVGLLIYWDITRTPDADVWLTRVDRDTTFFVGMPENTGEGSTRLSVLASGIVDDSTASLAIDYPEEPVAQTAIFAIPAGSISRLYQSDFYANRAKVTYRHGTVKYGQLRLRIALAYPPETWQTEPAKTMTK